MPNPSQASQRAAYWKANLRLVLLCLAIWFVVSYGFGILFAQVLNEFQLFGFKLGFWFAQQGSIYIYLLVIFFYAWRMNKLDQHFHVHEDAVRTMPESRGEHR